MLCAFDLLAIGETDLPDRPLVERKERLHALAPEHPHLHYMNDIATHGEALDTTAVHLGQKGIVAKRDAWSYKAGQHPAWRKIKNPDFYRREALGFRLRESVAT